MNYISIDNSEDLRSYLKKFSEKGHHIIALDIEAESNLHVYGEKLCLTQIFDGIHGIIIDPLNIDNNSLKLLFEDTNILKVMYDAGSDLSLLKNAYDIEIKSILDLRPAADLLEYEKKDLHSVIASELGIFLEEKRKYQKHNWINRPVSEQAIDYALNDVMYLLALKDVILAKMYAKKMLEPFLLKNLQIQNKNYTRGPEDKYRKISGYSRLRDDDKTVFRRVFDIRDKYARLCDMPAHNVIRKTDLIRIVNDETYIGELRFSKRFGQELVDGIVDELKRAVRTHK